MHPTIESQTAKTLQEEAKGKERKRLDRMSVTRNLELILKASAELKDADEPPSPTHVLQIGEMITKQATAALRKLDLAKVTTSKRMRKF